MGVGTVGGGLIPAHAGKTATFRPARRCERAHPRSRGENQSLCNVNDLTQGSSPLTRGKRGPRLAVPTVLGLIPAHAGKTSAPSSPRSATWAHPRSRGENANPMGFAAIAAGSSPLTRGKREARPSATTCKGLIPAHAGKTPSRDSESPTNTAHPRSRGENSHRMGGTEFPEGSSPLTRGKLTPYEKALITRGLIPAHAGKTVEARHR